MHFNSLILLSIANKILFHIRGVKLVSHYMSIILQNIHFQSSTFI